MTMTHLKKTLRASIRKTCLLVSCFCPSAHLRETIRDCGDRFVIKLFRQQIEAFVSDYPKVYSEEYWGGCARPFRQRPHLRFNGPFSWRPTDDKAKFLDRVRLIKRLWSGRKVVIVVGRGSRFHFEDELFDNVESVDYIYGPSKNAFYEYENIMSEIRSYDKSSYLLLLVLGPTATVMAHELGSEGYQAIDFGQMPGKYRKARNYLFGSETPLPL